ncbi:radical SAM protein [Candidatus Bathyarchaeota archaeon]|nr:radical SAM protein [Candidatus Bathyarchaeota archaeon]
MKDVSSDPVECQVCHVRKFYVARSLAVCVDCIRERPELAGPFIKRAHQHARSRYSLPPSPPRNPNGIPCRLCSNECMIGVGERGYCGLRVNVKGRIKSLADTGKALLYAYEDPHPTNCCASWFCPAGTGCGYPRFARSPGPEHGYHNLAVFFYGCNFDCLFCQNFSHKDLSSAKAAGREEFKRMVESKGNMTCICYFGGSPEPQLPFAVTASREIVEAKPGRLMRICFEWNGCGERRLVREAAELSAKTGGNLKFDLKCFNEALSEALCGVSNRRAFENFEAVAREFFDRKAAVPNVTATTLLVPGYVDKEEVEAISRFIASIDTAIPYSLLVFHPDFEMLDLPVTPREQVESCYSTAKRHLTNVHVGNQHLLVLGGLT